jgi:sulfhydrogenase subunit delta
MKLKPPITLAWTRFTSCSGCQLMLLNCESSLAKLSEILTIRDFPLATSTEGKDEKIDVGLVEGSITTPAELESLLAFRRKVHLLVAVGACALTGGVNSLVRGERRQAMTKVYSGQADEWNSFPPQAIDHFVQVDGQIPGCPPEQSELLNSIGTLLHGGWPGHQVMPVCMECRINENPCLLERDRAPCLGPITLADCNARCPNLGVPCEGCRGVVAEANRDELCRLFLTAGLTDQEIRHRLERFGDTV